MMAMTADGKTAPASGLYAPFGSKRDLARLLALRAEADAVMSGARTVNTLPVTLGNSPRHCRARRLRGLPEQPVRIVVSGRGGVDPEAEVFRHRFSPVMVWVTERAPEERVALLRKAGASVKVFGGGDGGFWPGALVAVAGAGHQASGVRRRRRAERGAD